MGWGWGKGEVEEEGEGLWSRAKGRVAQRSTPLWSAGGLAKEVLGGIRRRDGGVGAGRQEGDERREGGWKQEGEGLSTRKNAICVAWNRVFFNETAVSVGRKELGVDREVGCSYKKRLLVSSEELGKNFQTRLLSLLRRGLHAMLKSLFAFCYCYLVLTGKGVI